MIVRLLGKRLGIRFLRNRLLKLWMPKESLEIMDLEHDFFLVRFSEWEDIKRVFNNGP